MDIEEAKKRIRDFMKENMLTVISTVDVDGNKPESAVIAFAERENFELIFGTSNTTRKYRNLQKNPNVSFVIGWDSNTGTVQYEGVARELSREESPTYSSILIAKNPRSEKFVHKEDQRYFLVKPTWIRILDMTKSPDETFEINF
ncbi:MAG: pyridoxamine 5'-phosphate oxidase family protein [bacterium]|nr:pyridoxamine 5'-phosphate oxidase family protein [bacterium]